MSINSCVKSDDQIKFRFNEKHTVFFDSVVHIQEFIDRRPTKEIDIGIKAALVIILEDDPNLDYPENVGGEY